MKAAFLHKPGDLRIEEVERPKIAKPDDVLIRIKAVGVCGSDVHYYERGRIGTFVVTEPLILGHECSGEVVEVGPEVRNLKPGDRVAIEPGCPDRRCWYCKTGKYNLCRTVPFMGSPPTHGAFREYVTWPYDFVFKLPQGVSFEEGAMVEPFAVGMQSAKRGDIKPGMSAVVIGSGPIGLATMLAAAGYGATTIIATDRVASRLAVARKLGAHHTINAAETDPVEAVQRITEGEGADVVLETAGTVGTARQAQDMVRRGGVLVLVGMFAEQEFPLYVMDVIFREYDVRGVFRYCNCFPPALALIGAGRADVKSLITHEFPLERAREAIEFARDRKDVAIKVVVKP
jgi:L-iditol 2-dehydrogenase